MEEKRRVAQSARLEKQQSDSLGRDASGLSGSADRQASPSGANLKRLKLKVGGSTLQLTSGQRPSPEVTPQSLPSGRSPPFEPPSPLEPRRKPPARKTEPPAPVLEERAAKRNRRPVIEDSEEGGSFQGGEDTDLSDSDSPPPVRKRLRTQEGSSANVEAEQGFREKRSPKPKVIWDPDGGDVQKTPGKPNKVKHTPEKAKRSAGDTANEGLSREAQQEALEVPGAGSYGASPTEVKRERRLSKPKVIWDPDDEDREFLKVVGKSPEPKGLASPKAPSPYVSPKKAAHKALDIVVPLQESTIVEPISETSISQTPKSPVERATEAEALKSPGSIPHGVPSVRTDGAETSKPLPSPHLGAFSHLPNPLESSRLGVGSNLTPNKRKDTWEGGVGTSRGGLTSQGFKPPPDRPRLRGSAHSVDARDEMMIGTEERGDLSSPQGRHGLASPGRRRDDKKRIREDTEAERQLKKEERARKRKADTEKAAREVQASAIQKILGQESTRKKREEAVQKRRDAKEEERLASGSEAAGDMVRVVDNATGVTVLWPAAVPFPVELAQAPKSAPPSRARCSAPNCANPYKYRHSKSLQPLCSLQCYQALQPSTHALAR